MNGMTGLNLKPFNYEKADLSIARLERQFRRHGVDDESEKARLLLRTMDDYWVRMVNHFLETSNPRNVYSASRAFLLQETKKIDKEQLEDFLTYIAPANMPPSEVYVDIAQRAPEGTPISKIQDIWLRNHKQHEKLFNLASPSNFAERVQIAEKAWKHRRTRTF